MAQTKDIEDVLLSIRRLVSGDNPPEPTAETSPVAPALVLEASNRVTEPEDPFQTVPTLSQGGHPGPVTSINSDPVPSEDVAQEAAAPGPDLQSAPELPSTEDVTDAANQEALDQLDPGAEIVDLAQAERDGRDAAHVLSEMDGDTAAITTDLSQEDPDASAWDQYSDPTPEPPAGYLEDTDYVADEGNVEPQISDHAVQEGTKGRSGAAAEGSIPASLSDPTERVDALEFVSVKSTQGAQGDAGPSVDADPDIADLGIQPGDDTIALDDEGFRDLIAEVVRQELAGDLGERITRNVRKLVRREIRQILSSGEFD